MSKRKLYNINIKSNKIEYDEKSVFIWYPLPIQVMSHEIFEIYNTFFIDATVLPSLSKNYVSGLHTEFKLLHLNYYCCNAALKMN